MGGSSADAGVDVTLEATIEAWQRDIERAERIVHVERVTARDGIFADLDPAPADQVAVALSGLGIDRLYRHQALAIANVRRAKDTVLVAGTASGKTLAYQVPLAENAIEGASALAIYPTKALAQDQLRSFHRLDLADIVAEVYDGDTPSDRRRWIRRHANVVLTNPDMLHIGILPNHARWAEFLSRLNLVVVDELHTLRGIFGSNVAHVLRRLRRLAAHYGSNPTFMFTSATIGNPGELAEKLADKPVALVEDDVSPTGERLFVLWNPPLDESLDGRRLSSLSEATDAYVDLLRVGHHTIAFARSRRGAELIHKWAAERLDEDTARRIAPYRAGYLAKDRRAVERALFAGELVGVSATNALELGIDVGGLDAAVITTFPGTLASLRQQAGRAGRQQEQSLAVLIAGQDALDQYYMSHPNELFRRPSEAAVVNPDNPDVLAAHMGCAAYELPLVPEDRFYFGEAMEETAPSLVQRGDLRVRDGKLFWARRESPAPAVNVRSSGGTPYTIATTSGELIGTMDRARVFGQAHEGAVYLHRGETYLVVELDQHLHEVRVEAADVHYYTQPKTEKDLRVQAVTSEGVVGQLGRMLGTVEVEDQVVAYQRKSTGSGEVLDTIPLDLPPQRLVTQAFWFTIPEWMFAEASIEWTDVPGTLHAAEHTAIAMLPMYAICDRWDVGGLSTPLHLDVGGPAFFIYDGYSGGAGIAPIGYEVAEQHLAATLSALEECPCRSGCPSCVVSPKCGNFNEPLSKHGAIKLLRTAIRTT